MKIAATKVGSAVRTFALLALLSGCGEKPALPPDLVRDSVERGPLKFSVAAGPPVVGIADPITVTLSVETPSEYEVRFPEAGEFGGKVRNLRSEPPAATPSGWLWTQVATIESYTAGPLEVPPLVVRYGKRLSDAAETQFDDELAVGTLRLEVRSALTSQDTVMSPRDITGVRLPPPRTLTAGEWALLGLSAAALTALTALLVRWCIRRARRPAPPIAAEVWAIHALEVLTREGLVERGQGREHYYRLTEIVRAYIERKFHLRAPEMTTEEFLTNLGRDRAALPYDAARLREFLNACDLVKYAAVQPRPEDAEDAMRTARAFVHATAAAAEEDARSRAAAADRERAA
jgi:hypothetical protein